MSPKRNRRSAQKYPALDPAFNLKTRQDQLEIDYVDQLSESEKDWLNRFNEEDVNANFNHPGKLVQKGKKRRKASYDRNNARNRDILTTKKAMGQLDVLDNNMTYNPEDEIIEAIDRKTLKKKLFTE